VKEKKRERETRAEKFRFFGRISSMVLSGRDEKERERVCVCVCVWKRERGDKKALMLACERGRGNGLRVTVCD
jgi:hypothetical protein